MRLAKLALLTALSFPPMAASGQGQIPIGPGQRVRVTAPDLGVHQQVGTLAALADGVLTLTADSTLRYPLTAVTLLEAYAGRQSHPWRGAGIGFLVGFGLGFVIYQGAAEDGCYGGASKANCAAVLGGSAGAIAGTLIGAFVGGFLAKTDKWEAVPLDGLQVRVMPRLGGFGVGVSIEF